MGRTIMAPSPLAGGAHANREGYRKTNCYRCGHGLQAPTAIGHALCRIVISNSPTLAKGTTYQYIDEDIILVFSVNSHTTANAPVTARFTSGISLRRKKLTLHPPAQASAKASHQIAAAVLRAENKSVDCTQSPRPGKARSPQTAAVTNVTGPVSAPTAKSGTKFHRKNAHHRCRRRSKSPPIEGRKLHHCAAIIVHHLQEDSCSASGETVGSGATGGFWDPAAASLGASRG